MSGKFGDKTTEEYFMEQAAPTIEALCKHFSSDENPGPKESDPFSAKCLFALKSLSEHFQSKIIQKVKEVTWASTDVAIKASSPLPSIYLSGKYCKISCLVC